MLATERWRAKKHPFFAFSAIKLALAARERCEALQHIKDRCVYAHEFPLPDLPSWFALYRSSTKVLRAYKRLLSISTDSDKTQLLLFRGLRKVAKIAPGESLPNPTPEDREKSLKYWEEQYSHLIEEIKSEIACTPIESEIAEKFHELMAKDELLYSFHFLVFSPCLLLYQMTPAELYRRALSRDVEALENLLKLDSLMIHDPAIGFQIQSIRFNGKTNDYETVIDAVKKLPFMSHSDISEARKSVKSDHAALIAIIAEGLKIPLKRPEIRRLYDALAIDLDGVDGRRCDPDITSSESFDKTIKTKMQQWQNKYQKTENQK